MSPLLISLLTCFLVMLAKIITAHSGGRDIHAWIAASAAFQFQWVAVLPVSTTKNMVTFTAFFQIYFMLLPNKNSLIHGVENISLSSLENPLSGYGKHVIQLRILPSTFHCY